MTHKRRLLKCSQLTFCVFITARIELTFGKFAAGHLTVTKAMGDYLVKEGFKRYIPVRGLVQLDCVLSSPYRLSKGFIIFLFVES